MDSQSRHRILGPGKFGYLIHEANLLKGDKERDLGLPITYLCDRYTVNLAKSQLGFIDFVVAPLFGLMKEVLPKIDISNLDTNKNKWKDLVDHYEEELSKTNN